MSATILFTCKEGYEKVLSREIAEDSLKVISKGLGWLLAAPDETPSSSKTYVLHNIPCFAYYIFENPTLINAASVNSLTEQLITLFSKHYAKTRLTESWPLSFTSSGNEQLLQHEKSVKKNWLVKMRKRMSKITKLAQEGIPHRSKFSEGFFVHFASFDQIFVSFKACSAGQQRMLMDTSAPSRSYLKIEEAFRVFGVEPQKKETVIDLGAAPGGWSFSALNRGALVTAIDNGPLKDPVKTHANVRHLIENALTYKHMKNKPVDWLLCDVLEEPDIIFKLLEKWLKQKWCRYFIANIKVGRNDPILLLKKIRHNQKGLSRLCDPLIMRQLYHDREEITLMGRVK
jgi:23S rRNA (cytidine2498-2'-O)-methyltransferase